ncbi:MAG: DNA repair protein RadA, partial [Bacteroidia bacterium]|nr:DNA repair protein RadA [Bacteroidia bacterium]
MAKTKSAFFCQNCGNESPKWLGKCPSCGSWNSFVEEVLTTGDVKNEWRSNGKSERNTRPKTLLDIVAGRELRTITPDEEINRVLGGGIVPGSLVLIGGEPGIGKSTLMLQLGLALKKLKVLYVSGEESEQQIKMRADRLGATSEQFFVLTETNTKNIFLSIESLQPELVIVDSIQTLYSGQIDSGAGGIAQVRHCTGELMKFSKETNTPVFLVGHITKDGTLAGPKVLEHMVDTVLQFEGDRHLAYRILRTTKTDS